MTLLDFPLNKAIRESRSQQPPSLDRYHAHSENGNFTWGQRTRTFVDTHDNGPPLPQRWNNNKQSPATKRWPFLLTCRGIPSLYYGDEAVLHNDTGASRPPYTRPMNVVVQHID